ncbi:WcaI family glycosyltransferase [Novosphingobium profundi]|uniref:WcaI family glycosyltransferase n=1 Tax=Novosphingobium profundi TaxID=1774954 RepID=UPI001BDA847D|nr:WcaI family glycosyltransferase [Novosphingobium profundi]MBT0668356.1 WcaI family glycosyltransferase [Novosphingobium profundi]
MVLGLNYAPEPVGIGPYTTGLAEFFAARGDTVEVVAGEAYYPQWSRYADQPRNGTRHEGNGVGITRVAHFIPPSPSGLKRMLHLASFSLTSLLPSARAARRIKADLVFTVAPSLLSVPVAWIAAKASGAKLWVHVQDFEVEAAMATGLLKPGGTASKVGNWLESRILKLADMASTISPQMCLKLREKGLAPEAIYELRNWANAEFATDQAEADAYRAQWGIGNRHVALYSGNIANKQGIEIIIEAAQLLRDRKDLVFVICGQGPNRARLAELSEGLDNVQLHDLQPFERMGGLLGLASLHLLPQIPGAADLVLPSKLTNMLISGRPVVATAAPDTGLASEVEGCGAVTPPGDAEAFANAIAALLDDTHERQRLGTAAAQRAEERWQKPTILSRLSQRFDGLLANA